MFTLKDAVRDRGVMVGASMYHEILETQRVDIDFLDWGGGGLGRCLRPFTPILKAETLLALTDCLLATNTKKTLNPTDSDR